MTAENRTPRLHRLARIYVRSPVYFVTTCTANRRHILATEAIHESLLHFAQEGPEHGAWIGAYVLMPDHVHAFVAIDDQKVSLSVWMKSLKNALSKTMRSKRIPAPHWQKTFFDHVLRGADSYTEKWHYVRENPVRAGLVRQWQDCPFQGEIFPLQYRSES
jgi:REP element-mobilizing transposase RayT